MSFSSLGISNQIIQAAGYETPSEVQKQVIPVIISGKDVICSSQTGTGKTAAFAFPLIQMLSKTSRPRGNKTQSLILVPTRELAAQVNDNIKKYSQNLPIKSDVVFGGVNMNSQMLRLRGGVDILVATPGRLLDLHKQNAINLKEVKILVLDEADKLLSQGFNDEVNKILELLPKTRQNLLFSATYSDEVRELSKSTFKDPLEIIATPKNTKADLIEHYIYPLDQNQKMSALLSLLKNEDWKQVLVFRSTKNATEKLVKKLTLKGVNAAAIHGGKSQALRTKALADFNKGHVKVLVATEIISRGIDISELLNVVNFDLPKRAEGYIHRIGRTGRAGKQGTAISFVSADEFDMLQMIERLLQQLIPRKNHPEIMPTKPLPESVLNTKAFKKGKPKKQKQTRGIH